MANQNPNVVSASTVGTKLPDGVIDLDAIPSSDPVDGCRVFTHLQRADRSVERVAGMCVLEPGSSPHPPHQHPEEEFMIVSSGTGEIFCAGKTTKVSPGAMMLAGNVMHGITNTGKVPRRSTGRSGSASNGSTGQRINGPRVSNPLLRWPADPLTRWRSLNTYPFTGSRKKKRANGVARSGSISSAPCRASRSFKASKSEPECMTATCRPNSRSNGDAEAFDKKNVDLLAAADIEPYRFLRGRWTGPAPAYNRASARRLLDISCRQSQVGEAHPRRCQRSGTSWPRS